MADEQVTEVVQPEQPVTQQEEQHSPEEFRKMQEALKAANKEAADRRKRLEALEKAEADRKTAEMTEAEKLAARLKEYESELTQYKRNALIRQIADEVGLPPALAARLQGSTEEELKEDALKLLELVPTAKKPTLAATNPGNAQRTETPAEKRERLLGNKGDIWKGGGINWPD